VLQGCACLRMAMCTTQVFCLYCSQAPRNGLSLAHSDQANMVDQFLIGEIVCKDRSMPEARPAINMPSVVLCPFISASAFAVHFGNNSPSSRATRLLLCKAYRCLKSQNSQSNGRPECIRAAKLSLRLTQILPFDHATALEVPAWILVA
jgi:hypothetical protein